MQAIGLYSVPIHVWLANWSRHLAYAADVSKQEIKDTGWAIALCTRILVQYCSGRLLWYCSRAVLVLKGFLVEGKSPRK